VTIVPDTGGWTARDWRRMAGILFLGLGGIVVTILAWRSLTLLAEKSRSPWPVAYFAYGTLVLIGIVLTGLSAILGRRTFKLKVGPNTVESVGEDAADRVQDALDDA
jgi:hypothetical protein